MKMHIGSPEPAPVVTPSDAGTRIHQDARLTLTRAAVAVLWAIAYLLALHGQRILTASDIPVLAGLLLAAYPVIDAVASLSEWRLAPSRGELGAAVVIDALAIIGLLIATFGLHTRAVLIAFGAWALASGLLQLARAWRAGRPRRVQLPLIISGGVSAVAGIFFAATASQHVAQLPYLGGYAVLGAIFFVAWTFADRQSSRSS